MEHVPSVRHGHSGPRQARNARKAPSQWRYGALGRRTATVVGAAALVSLVLPSGLGSAASANPGPDLQTLVARARTLSNEINSLDEQYNGLRVALSQARAESQVAQRTYAQDIVRLSAGQLSIGQLAAQSYMNNGLDTSLELLTTSSAQNLLSRASLMEQLQTRERGPGRPDGRGGRGGPAGQGNLASAGQGHVQADRRDGRQAGRRPEEDQHPQQRGVRQGHGHLQQDRQLACRSISPPPIRSARRRCGSR